jgi:hypothetical protein
MKVYLGQKALTKMVGSSSYHTFRKWSWSVILIDAIGAKRRDVVSCCYSFVVFLF